MAAIAPPAPVSAPAPMLPITPVSKGPGEAGEEHEHADAEDRASGGVAAVRLLGWDAHAAQCAP
jgi:hypothetical protein